MDLESVLNYRRSVRQFIQNKDLDISRVAHCVEMARLAPSSSNMQLWEVYHIVDPSLIQKITPIALGQKAVSTANQLVIFVTRQDLHRKRASQVLEFEKGNIQRHSAPEDQERRMAARNVYYGKMMPFLYARFFGILGIFRKLMTSAIGIFRPMFRNSSEADQRVVLHKSCALAAQTFMIAMANEGFDTCPLEGFDSCRLKKVLGLPYGAEISMMISCGYRDGDKGIWGERYRIPFEEQYFKI